jgi:hypothetical protein
MGWESTIWRGEFDTSTQLLGSVTGYLKNNRGRERGEIRKGKAL